MRSSYVQHDYDLLFKALVQIHKPDVIVECGVLDGYSLFAMGEVAETYGGKTYGIDLFDDYEFKHGSQTELTQQILLKKILNTTLIKKDAIGEENA